MVPTNNTSDKAISTCSQKPTTPSMKHLPFVPPLSPGKRPQESRFVAFDERVRVRKTIHINNYSHDEVDATWYSKEELQAIKKDIRHVAKLIEDGLVTNRWGNDYSFRGVDLHVPDAARRRTVDKSVHCEAVLMEQDLQVEVGSCDPESMASVSRRYSKKSAELAHKVALIDEIEALTC
jgi:hypothetical protein